MRFKDRRDAGGRLAAKLAAEELDAPVVLALPRGGVLVAGPVAAALGAPLAVFVARKVGAPGQPEYGIGAVAEGSDEVVTTAAAETLGITGDQIRSLAADERTEVERRVRLYRGDHPLPQVEGRDVVLVDDGLATGVTAEAALRALRRMGPRRLVLAVPTCARDTVQRLQDIADSIVCIVAPEQFGAVGSWYDDFGQTTDEEVLALLDDAEHGTRDSDGPSAERTVQLEVPGVAGSLHGDLTVPSDAAGIVLFAHGSGSSRRSPRNRSVAETLQDRGLATMLIDLLTEEEGRADATTGHLRFDIGLLAERMDAVTQWLSEDPSTKALPIAYFGASTGAAAALVAAARAKGQVAAVVSRGGRPDLAGAALREVSAPTLLIVGGRDDAVLALNEGALAELRAEGRLEVVEGATHLFEEAGALEQVAALAGDWFTTHLRS
jgi:putative phosphoribosyl transferase